MFEDAIAAPGLPHHCRLQNRLQTASRVLARRADLIAVEIEELKLARADRIRLGLSDYASVGSEQPDPNARWLQYALSRVGIIQVGPVVTQRLPTRQPGIESDILVQVYVCVLSRASVDRGRMRADCRLNDTEGEQS